MALFPAYKAGVLVVKVLVLEQALHFNGIEQHILDQEGTFPTTLFTGRHNRMSPELFPEDCHHLIGERVPLFGTKSLHQG